MINRIILTIEKIFFLAVMSIVLTGCGVTTLYEIGSLVRSWECEYQEEYFIKTEPEGSKIYVQNEYIGISPIKGKTGFVNFEITQSGPVKFAYDFDNWSGAKTNYRKVGAPTWDPIKIENIKRHYTVKAFKSGYVPVEQIVEIGNNDDVFMRTIGNNIEPDKENKMGTRFMGKRNLLLVLQPNPENITPQAKEQQQQQQQQQQTIIIPNQEKSSESSCISDCKKMFLKGELKGQIEECYKLLCD